jgi:hypothetical protein
MFRIPWLLKKAVSILLVLLLLFNSLGFYGLLRGLQYKNTLDLVKRLDNQQYSKDETITLKIPFAIPYQLDSNGFERVDGEFQYQGEIYRLVEQKLERDTLFIVCIKDHASNRIQEALEDYVKTFTDKPSHAKNIAKTFASFIKDFLPAPPMTSSLSDGWSYSVVAIAISENMVGRNIPVFTPPPKFTAQSN